MLGHYIICFIIEQTECRKFFLNYDNINGLFEVKYVA